MMHSCQVLQENKQKEHFPLERKLPLLPLVFLSFSSLSPFLSLVSASLPSLLFSPLLLPILSPMSCYLQSLPHLLCKLHLQFWVHEFSLSLSLSLLFGEGEETPRKKRESGWNIHNRERDRERERMERMREKKRGWSGCTSLVNMLWRRCSVLLLLLRLSSFSPFGSLSLPSEQEDQFLPWYFQIRPGEGTEKRRNTQTGYSFLDHSFCSTLSPWTSFKDLLAKHQHPIIDPFSSSSLYRSHPHHFTFPSSSLYVFIIIIILLSQSLIFSWC